jgi:uncharacterized protein YdeI (YjbR/CyaY-like superfamily)
MFEIQMIDVNLNEALIFNNEKKWRNWLEENHRTCKEIWLIHYKKSSEKKSITPQEAIEEAICFGWIDSTLKKIDEKRYILRYSPRREKSVWSKINKETAEKMISSGKMTEYGLEKINSAKKHGLWNTAYTNKVKEKVPLDLRKALISNKIAWNNFQNFANSYRNMYIGWIQSAKTDITRKKRINEVVKRSEENKKPGVI